MRAPPREPAARFKGARVSVRGGEQSPHQEQSPRKQKQKHGARTRFEAGSRACPHSLHKKHRKRFERQSEQTHRCCTEPCGGTGLFGGMHPSWNERLQMPSQQMSSPVISHTPHTSSCESECSTGFSPCLGSWRSRPCGSARGTAVRLEAAGRHAARSAT
eukprot:4198633-Prymnesium_polylepis.1